jgi:hypothetical protein
VLYRGQKEALRDFLPLEAWNWITCGNALRLDWLSACPPLTTGVKHHADDLFQTPLEQAQIDFENEGGETYICGNPPYRGSQWQTEEQKSDLKANFDGRTKNWKSLDYVSGWFMKAAVYGTKTEAVAAFVATNSICQGRQVDTLWSLILCVGVRDCICPHLFQVGQPRQLQCRRNGCHCRYLKSRGTGLGGFSLRLTAAPLSKPLRTSMHTWCRPQMLSLVSYRARTAIFPK